jgi:inner membrane protein involved in colicin E2 resistance
VSEPTPRPGRAFAVYSALRLGLLVVCFVLLRLIVGDDNLLLVVGAAVLLSALLSLVLLRRQRDAFTSASMARADQRRAERQARRDRLDGHSAAGEGPPDSVR